MRQKNYIFVLSGSVKFESKGDESEILTPLKTRFHKSFQPHSLTTHNEKMFYH